MNELAIAHINANVAVGPVHGVEKHQIAGYQFFFVDALRVSGLLFGFAGKHQSDGLLEYGFDKAAAVKTGFYRAAPALVRHAQKSHGVNHQLRGFVGDALAGLRHLRKHAFVGQPVVKFVDGGCCLRRGAHHQG